MFDSWQVQDWIGAYGAFVATVLAVFQGVASWIRRRPWVDSSYSLIGHPEMDDAITLANLRSIPLQVRHWDVEWVPPFSRWWVGKRDQTPERDPEYEAGFTILGHETHTLTFSGHEKITWNHKVAKRRKLVLTLKVYGRRQPLRIRIK